MKGNNQYHNNITNEEIEFIKENFYKYTAKELTKKINDKFSQRRNYDHIKNYAREKLGLKKGDKFFFSKEQNEWLKKNVPNMSRQEALEKFNQKFSTKKTIQALRVHCNRELKIKFNQTKGREQANIINTKPLGSEFASGVEGKKFIYVKIAYGKKEQNYKSKHHIIWEKHNGEIPKGKKIIFCDGNRENCDIDNLMLVDENIIASINKNGFYGKGKKVLEAGIEVLQAQLELNKIMKGR